MKILFITPKIPFPPLDGHRKSMWGVIKYLSQLGHQIDLVCYDQNENVAAVKNEIEKHARLFALEVSTKNTLSGAFRNLFSTVPYNLWKFDRPELKLFLTEYFKTENPNVIHVVNTHMGFIVDFIREYSSAPVVLRLENLEMMIMKRYCENQKNFLLKIYSFAQYKKFIKYEPSLCAKFDTCVLISPEDEKKLLELNPAINTVVIPIGVEKDLFEITSSKNISYSLAHIGSLNWYPNLDGFNWFLSKIFPIVLEELPETNLFVYGGGVPDNFEVPDEVKEHVFIMGFVENIWDELKNKSLAIVPLRIGGGIRVKILELMAAGKNVLSTSVGKEGMEIEDNSEILIADTEREFAEKIINFFRDKFDSAQIAFKGRIFAEKNYSWEKIALTFENIYTKLLNQKNK